jgi:large subunit ribosomal protein L21
LECEALNTYAIVQTGGKQYRVREGDTIRVESLPGDEGDEIELSDVLMVSRDGEVVVGTPTVPETTVRTEVVGHGRNRKVVVFKYKAKTRYRRRRGHRQPYTDLKVIGI